MYTNCKLSKNIQTNAGLCYSLVKCLKTVALGELYRKRERQRERNGRRGRKREDIESGKDMHSIIESTNCGGPSAWSSGSLEKSIHFIIGQRGTNRPPWRRNLSCLLMKLLGTSLFFVVLHFLEKSSVILNVNVKQNKEEK